jgi:H+/Cl- antiporter ClcA
MKSQSPIQKYRQKLQEIARSRDWLGRASAFFSKIQKNERIGYNILQAIPFWSASVIVGLVAVGYAQLFSLAESISLELHAIADWSIFIILPVCMVTAWWVVRRYAPGARGSGIPQVIAALELANDKEHDKVPKLLSIRIILVKIASSLLMIMGGAAIGREGPTIQISAAIFRKVNEMLPAWWPKVSRRNMILTGAAAGLAAAFNTPLGGIVFAVEELSKTHFTRFRTAIFTAVIIAGLAAQAISGPYLYLGYPAIGQYTLSAFWGVVLVAAIGGLAGGATSKAILSIFAWKDRFRKVSDNVLFILLCAMVMASMIYFLTEEAMGSGKEIMNTALFTSDKRVEWYLPIVRIVGPISSFTTGASGGIFAPGLSAGASIGAMVSGWFDLNGPNSNLLIVAGMVAFLTGITRSPFTSAILVLEMTDRHSLIFHLMAAGMVANIFAYFVERKSLYENLKDRFLKELEPR